MYRNFLKEHVKILSWIIKTVDIVIFFLSGLLAYYLQFHHLYLNNLYIAALLLGSILIVSIGSFFGVYESLRARSIFKLFGTLYLAVFGVMLILASLAFITKTGAFFSRSWFFFWAFSAILFLSIFRLFMAIFLRIMRRRGWNQRQIIIIGTGEVSSNLVKQVKEAVWSGLRIVEILTEENTHPSIEGISINSIPADLEEYINKLKIDEVWLVYPLQAENKIQEILHALRHNVITIRYFPDMFGAGLFKHSASEIFGFFAVNIVSSPMVGSNLVIKWLEDKILSSIILLIIIPVMLAIALLVKLSSPGPIFYRQERVGWNGEKFNMLKFRSMPIDVEKATGAVWARQGERRATKIGAFLRKTSLDELPQFINVLKGDMSIVGPRPERPVFVDKFKNEVPGYMKKHLMKAGITGWAQINGWRGDTDLNKRIEYDLNYIQHWSLWFDLKIIFLTIFKGFMHKNAY